MLFYLFDVANELFIIVLTALALDNMDLSWRI